MNYYPQNNQYNGNGIPTSYPYQQYPYPYMQTIGGTIPPIGGNIPPIGYGYNGGYYAGSYGYNPYKIFGNL